MTRIVKVGNIPCGDDRLFLISGPCVIETEDIMLRTAEKLKEVGERLKLPAPTLTSHLNVLRHAGLVRDAREGRSIRCRADYARMNALLSFLTENCCGSDTSSCAPACAPQPKRRPLR